MKTIRRYTANARIMVYPDGHAEILLADGTEVIGDGSGRRNKRRLRWSMRLSGGAGGKRQRGIENRKPRVKLVRGRIPPSRHGVSSVRTRKDDSPAFTD